MITNRINFLRCLTFIVAVCCGLDALAVQAPNPRGSSVAQSNNRSANDSSTVSRVATPRAAARNGVVRPSTQGAVVSNARRGGASVARTAVSGATIRGSNARTGQTVSVGRSATTPNASRAGISRATAVFNDMSKIGGGYAACRESYATCMDQFCANANDTYRRCYCSSRYADFRNTENALDEAKTLLMRFEDNNLNAVDKTAAEVNAMYSATIGEAAIKNDTSGAAKILDEIGDLLSGKKKTYTANSASNSLGILSFDITDDVDDIWADGGDSLFSGGGQNLSELEGVDLYNAANKQCMKMISDSCESSAVSNMARSSYSILITQDCNAYQKNIDKKVENVKQTVRTAEKYLREARLEEYRSHNSADVNECITKVRTAIQNDVACGANYKRCLDYTGAYISQSTGEAIYSPRLFKLPELIKLDGENSDVLRQNDQFDKFLESRKVFAASALDSCRDIQKLVWEEFKRTALIEIAQAQDEKIEEVKMSCVSTMADCYDTQSSALKSFDKKTAQLAGAVSAYAARQMCADKVIACASLYGDTANCTFDGNGRLTAGNNTSTDNIDRCGLGALLKFVDTVDNIRIADGCETSLKNYATELCTDTTTGKGYPWNCRLMSPHEINENITKMADTYCSKDIIQYNFKSVDSMIKSLVDDISMQIADSLMGQCEEVEGRWLDSTDGAPDYETTFYRNVYGTSGPRKHENGEEITEYGVCVKNTVKYACEAQNVMTGGAGYAKYNSGNKTCTFSPEWYQFKCEKVLDGYWDNGTCYTK